MIKITYNNINHIKYYLCEIIMNVVFDIEFIVERLYSKYSFDHTISKKFTYDEVIVDRNLYLLYSNSEYFNKYTLENDEDIITICANKILYKYFQKDVENIIYEYDSNDNFAIIDNIYCSVIKL